LYLTISFITGVPVDPGLPHWTVPVDPDLPHWTVPVDPSLPHWTVLSLLPRALIITTAMNSQQDKGVEKKGEREDPVGFL